MFAQHFPLVEWERASDRPLHSAEKYFAEELSHMLEVIRSALGDRPLVITSFVRTDAVVRTTGARSQHADGTAVDVRKPADISWATLSEVVPAALRTAGKQWGQFIVYPWESPGHFHLSLPTGQARGATLAQNTKDGPFSAINTLTLPDRVLAGGSAPAPADAGVAAIVAVAAVLAVALLAPSAS